MIRAFYKPYLLYGTVSVRYKLEDWTYLPRPEYVFTNDSGVEIHTNNVNDFEFFHEEWG